MVSLFLCDILQLPHTVISNSEKLTHPTCTNEILISDVNSDKNSLAIIYMCLKMYCLKIRC